MRRPKSNPHGHGPFGPLKPTLTPSATGALAVGSISRLLKTILDVAYGLMVLVTGLMLVAFVVSVFIPLDNINITATDGTDGRLIPMSRPLLLFGVGAICVYFSSFMLILRSLRAIIRSLIQGDPFQPGNVSRLRHIGIILAVVTFGVWAAQVLMARLVAPGIMDPQGLKDLLTPIFSILIVFVLAEIFREGARLRRESELTI